MYNVEYTLGLVLQIPLCVLPPDSYNPVAVLSGGIIGGVALITLISTAVIAVYIYIQYFK